MWGVAPVVVSVCDCTDHMVDGKKKGVEYIMKFFQENLEEWYESHMYTDCFFFDRAANKKWGANLCANYPQDMCFNGGDHVLSLLFIDLSKLKPIQVTCILSKFTVDSIFLTMYQRLVLLTC